MIHPSSVISPKAEIGSNVTIGPFCRIHDHVTIGDGCMLDSHVVIGSEAGEVVIGSNNKFYGFSLIGGPPQDLKFKGEKTKLLIGDGNIIRECVTISVGTVTGHSETKIGNSNLFMAYCHIAHDDIIGDSNVLANSCQLAGHVTIESKVTLGAGSMINQFVRIGKHAFLGGASMINKDIIPYCMGQGNYATVRGTNKIGLERSGYSENTILNINRAIRILTKGGGTIQEALARIADECEKIPEIENLVAFTLSSERGIAI
jgi:UDP-N-acetylglucosamine acyltransferase